MIVKLLYCFSEKYMQESSLLENLDGQNLVAKSQQNDQNEQKLAGPIYMYMPLCFEAFQCIENGLLQLMFYS